MSDRVHFASHEWVKAATTVLEELVAEHGEAGHTFSVCEIFTDAPSSIASDGTAAWYFFIDGQSVTVSEGEAEGTDVTIRADYQSALPGARLVYTPESLAELAKQPPPEKPAQVDGDMSKAPPYLIHLHNRMAEVTA
ncbi:MAG: hypothetical protein AAF525_14050 [Pseudomonadota bacterium]